MWIVLFHPQNLLVLVVDLCSLWVYFLKVRLLWTVMFLAWQDYLREAGQRLHRRAGCAVQPAGGGDLAQHSLLRLQHWWAGLRQAAAASGEGLYLSSLSPTSIFAVGLHWWKEYNCPHQLCSTSRRQFPSFSFGPAVSVLTQSLMKGLRIHWNVLVDRDELGVESESSWGNNQDLWEFSTQSLSLFLRGPVSYQWTHADEIEVWGHWGSPGWKIGGNLVCAFCEKSLVWKKRPVKEVTHNPLIQG